MPTNQTGKRRAIVSDAVRQAMLDAALNSMEGVLAAEQADESGADDSHVHVHLHQGTNDSPTDDSAATVDAATDARLTKIEKTLDAIMAKLTKDGDLEDDDDADDDKKKKKKEEKEEKEMVNDDDMMTADSKALETSYRSVVADAEVLVPGFTVPTFDAAAKRKVTIDSMCAIRRKALDVAFNATVEGKSLIGGLIEPGATLDSLPCGEVAAVFKAAAGSKRLLNNRASTGDAGSLPNHSGVHQPAKVLTIADLNKINREFYATQH